MFAKLALTVATALSLVAAPVTGTALASSQVNQTSSLATSASATITPASPLYGLVQFWNSLELAVPMSSTAKANLEMRIARADAAAAMQMMATGNASQAVGPMDGYAQAMTNAKAELGKHPSGMEELNLLATSQAGQEAAQMANRSGLHANAVAALKAAETNTSNPVAQAAIANVIARLAGTSTQAILSMHAHGLTWAQIANQEGLKLGVRFNPHASLHANAHAGAGASGTSQASTNSSTTSARSASTPTNGSASGSGSVTTRPAGSASSNGQAHGSAFSVFGLSF